MVNRNCNNCFVCSFCITTNGALADQRLKNYTYILVVDMHQHYIFFFTYEGQIYIALFWFVIANIGFEMGSVFCNAYLPHIAPKDKIGRISVMDS